MSKPLVMSKPLSIHPLAFLGFPVILHTLDRISDRSHAAFHSRLAHFRASGQRADVSLPRMRTLEWEHAMAIETRKTPPTLNDLLVGFVNRNVDAAAIEAEAGALGDVEPHEVAVGFRVDPALAWREGVAALAALNQPVSKISAPAEWSAVVVRHDAVAAQPLALGCYPQRVRDLSALLQATDLSAFRPSGESRPASISLGKWAAKQCAAGEKSGTLLAAAVLRAAGDFDAAAPILDQADSDADVDNERAALLWQRGEWEQAEAIWKQLPDSAVAWFNRGMSALFLNQKVQARECLKKAVAQLPDSSGWHHLASLYLALSEIRK
jgi:tetratricopeptide (TPR) repeat protein